MSYNPPEILDHIETEIKVLLEIKKRVSRKQFLKDEFLKRTATRSFEIIGEATKKLPKEFRETHSEIEWKRMAGMRDILIHNYLEVDYELLWTVMEEEIPLLKKLIRKLNRKLNRN